MNLNIEEEEEVLVPASAMQKEEKNKSKQNEVRDLVKVTVLKEEEGLPNLIVCSLHDTEPVHFLSTCVEEVIWIGFSWH